MPWIPFMGVRISWLMLARNLFLHLPGILRLPHACRHERLLISGAIGDVGRNPADAGNFAVVTGEGNFVTNK